MKIKVHEQINGAGKKQYQRNDSIGKYDDDILSASEVENNPSKYEVTESTSTGRNILREAPHSQQRLTTADKRRQLEHESSRQKMFKSTRTELREDAGDLQQHIATSATLCHRHFVPVTAGADDAYRRNDVPGEISNFSDGSWAHMGEDGAMLGRGKSKSQLESYLDTQFPIGESFRDRTVNAFKALGLSEAEAIRAANKDGNLLSEAYAEVLKRAVNFKPTVDPRVAILRNMRDRK